VGVTCLNNLRTYGLFSRGKLASVLKMLLLLSLILRRMLGRLLSRELLLRSGRDFYYYL